MDSGHGPIVPAGGYMGEGMLPIPEKVVRSWRSWRPHARGRGSLSVEERFNTKRTGPVTDVASPVWSVYFPPS